MGLTKVKNVQKEAYGAQDDGNRAIKKFCSANITKCLGPMRPLIRPWYLNIVQWGPDNRPADIEAPPSNVHFFVQIARHQVIR
jgi:hypothetical protein